jgi:cysteine-rich repeat protein
VRTWAFVVLFAATVLPACGDDVSNVTNCSSATCDDGNPCNGTEACNASGKCEAGTVPDEGAKCGDGMTCQANACAPTPLECTDAPATECADKTPNACQVATFSCSADHKCVAATDPAKRGQACDTADATKVCFDGACVAAAAPTACGNGKLEAGEDCDDGNTANFDGCDSACVLEQDARIISLQQQFTHDTFCTKDGLGEALAAAAQPTIQQTWDQPINDGSMSIAFKFLGLDATLGPTTDTDFKLGFVKNTTVDRTIPDPDNPTGDPLPNPDYHGDNDLDWWYTVDPTSLDANGAPLVQLDGHIKNGHLTAGPGKITVDLLFALSPATVDLFNTRVDAQFDTQLGQPVVSTGGKSPGHLPSENVDPDLQTFIVSSAGQMCSDVSTKSLFDAVIPPLLFGVCQEGDPNNPTQTFAPDNTLLDVFVFGCTVFDNPLAGIGPAQPDGSLDGATYHFGTDPVTRKVSTCTKDGQPGVLADCLANATFGTSFKFKSDRVILRR